MPRSRRSGLPSLPPDEYRLLYSRTKTKLLPEWEGSAVANHRSALDLFRCPPRPATKLTESISAAPMRTPSRSPSPQPSRPMHSSPPPPAPRSKLVMLVADLLSKHYMLLLVLEVYMLTLGP